MRLHLRCRFLDSKPVNTPSELGSISASAPSDDVVFPHPIESVLTSSRPSPGPSLTSFCAPFGGINGQITPKPVSVPGLLDLELLHHYTTSTCFPLSSIPSNRQIWQIAVPREAKSHGCLLHALLAISTVNLWYVNPTKRHLYERAALHHWNLALATSIPALNEVTRHNCRAQFAMSGIVSVLSFVSPHSGKFGMPSDPVNDILSVFTLIRGVTTVVQSAQEWIAQGSLGALIDCGWNPTTSPLSEDASVAFEKLFDTNEKETLDPSTRDIYRSTIQSLKKIFDIHTVVRDQPGLVFTWLVVVQASYITQLEKKKPMAVTILAHYAVLLHTSNGQWWLEGRGAHLVEFIRQILPPEWLPAILWPRKAVKMGWKWNAELDPAASGHAR